MSKEPIQLGHSVERHAHHDSTEHHHGPPEEKFRDSQENENRFNPDTLSSAELFFTILFAGLMFIGFIALVIFIVLN